MSTRSKQTTAVLKQVPSKLLSPAPNYKTGLMTFENYFIFVMPFICNLKLGKICEILLHELSIPLQQFKNMFSLFFFPKKKENS